MTELSRYLAGYDQYDTGADSLVQLGEGVAVQRHAFIELTDEPWLPYLVRAVVEKTPSGPQCVDLRLVARPGGPPVTPAGLRQVPLGRVVRQVERNQVVLHQREDGSWAASAGDQSRRDRAAYRRAMARVEAQERRWRLDETTLRKVAAVYREALAVGEQPTATVQSHFGLNTRGQAAKWVRRAREEGHLGPAPGRRKKGELSAMKGSLGSDGTDPKEDS